MHSTQAEIAPPQWFDSLQSIGLWMLPPLVGFVVPMLFIGRGVAAILVPIIGGITGSLALRVRWLTGIAAWRHNGMAIAIAAMLAVWLFSVSLSLRPSFFFLIWLQAAGLLLLIATLPQLLTAAHPSYALALRTLILCSALGSAIAAVAIFVWPPILSYVRSVDTPLSYMAALRLKSYAAVLPCLAPVLIWAGFRLDQLWTGLAILAIIVGLVVVHGTHNKAAIGGYVGALACPFVVAVFDRLPSRMRMFALVAGAFALVLTGVLVISKLPTMPFDGSQSVQLPTWLADQHRQVIWGFVFDRAMERPWFGWGPSMANFLPGANESIPGIGQTFVPLHAHNWILQLLSDVGVVGLAAAIVVIALVVRHLVRLARTGMAAGWVGLSLTGAFFVSTLANFSIWQSWWQSVSVILLSLCLAAGRPSHQSKCLGESR